MSNLNDQTLNNLVALKDALVATGLTIASAESCTGGLIASLLTELPGSSNYFLGGVVTYSNESKSDLIGVSADDIKTYGAVSEIVACQMAVGVKKRFGASIGISTTGIAGPEGGTPTKPVGTVWLGIAYDGKVSARNLQLSGTRAEIRSKTCDAAIAALLNIAKGSSW
jgi:PncC family amidohydrolase